MRGRAVHVSASAPDPLPGDVALICVESARQADTISWCIQHMVSFVSCANEPSLVTDLLRYRQGDGIIGCGLTPGLTGLLSAHAARWIPTPREVSTAVVGAAGPACARQFATLAKAALPVADESSRMMGGRVLSVLPPPIGNVDCVPLASSDRTILTRMFPSLERISSRVHLAPPADPRQRSFAAFRQRVDRKDSAGYGGVSVEVWGDADQHEEIVHVATVGRPATLTAQTLVVGTSIVHSERDRPDTVRPFAACAPSTELLAELDLLGLKVQKFSPGD